MEINGKPYQQSNESGLPIREAFKEIESLLTSAHIESLWIKMTSTYGHRWVSSYGEKDDGTWLAGLRGISKEQIASGYIRLVESGEEWPPSLPEFRRLCFGYDDNELRSQAMVALRKKLGSFDYDHLSNDRLDRKITAMLPEIRKQIEQNRINENMLRLENK